MLRLGSIKIGTRLLLIVAAAIVAALLVGAFGLYELKSNMLEDRKTKTRDLVEVAITTAEYYHDRELAGEMTAEEAQKTAAAVISNMRYAGGTNYFFAFDDTPTMVFHGLKPDLAGRDLRNAKDGAGKKHYIAFVEMAKKNGQGFVDYTFKDPDISGTRAKLSFVKEFKPWNWIIATGIYIDDVNAVFMRSLMVMSGVAAAVLLVVVAFLRV